MEGEPMFMSRKITTILALATTAAGVAAFAASAQAVTISDNSLIIIAGDPDASFSGTMLWDYTDGKVTPRLTGTLTMTDERCFRVRVTSYDGDTPLHDTHGAKRCVHDESSPRDQPIDFGDVPDALTDMAAVTIEEQNQNNDDWVTLNPDITTLSHSTVRPFSDSVKLTGVGVDFGGPDFDVATGDLEPWSNAGVSWSIDDGGATATLDGDLYLDDFAGMCGRVLLRYLDDAGTEVEKLHSDPDCASDGGYYPEAVTLTGARSPEITQLEVTLQSSLNLPAKHWSPVGTPKTVSIAQYE
jgi:hypothetical protein